MRKLRLTVNERIKSRITYSVRVPRLNPDDLKTFLYAQFDLVGLGHNTFSQDALALIVRSSEGILRRTRNLCLCAMLEALRDRQQVVGLDQVNRVLLQPHWRKDHDLEPL
jgi:type II secretory pathway predicted ATPase ExeA